MAEENINNTEQRQFRTLDDIYGYIDAEKRKSDAELEEIRRRGKAQEAIMDIGEAGRALANLFYTTKGSPNAYDASKSMSDVARAWYERAMKEREARRDANYNYALNHAKRIENERTFSLKQERARLAQENFERQMAVKEDAAELARQREQRLADMQEFNKQHKNGQLDVARMNAWVRKQAQLDKRSTSEIRHMLASWEETTEDIKDEKGRKIGTKRKRIVINPQGEVEQKEDVVPVQGGGNAANGGGGKSLGIGVGSSQGKKLGIKVK